MDFGTFFATYLVIILAANALLAFIPAYIAREKGRSYGAFWALSFFTTIFVGLIAVLALPPVEKKEARTLRTDEHGKVLADETEMPETIKCPFCAEIVKSEASICRYCQKDISRHIAALKAQITKNVVANARETAARLLEFQMLAEANRLVEIERRKERSAKIRKISRNPVTIAIATGAVIALSWYGISTDASNREAASKAAQNVLAKEQKAMEKKQQQQDARDKIAGQLDGCLNASEFTVDFDGAGVRLLTDDLAKVACASAALLESSELPDELVNFAQTGEGINSILGLFDVGNGKVQVTRGYGEIAFKISFTR